MAETAAAPEAGTIERITELADRFYGAWNLGPGASEKLLELMTEDIDYKESPQPEAARGHDELREFVESQLSAFPDFHVERISEPLVSPDGSRAAICWRGTMTHTGTLDPPGIPPTGKRVEWESVDLQEYRDGKIARHRSVYNVADILQQLGLLG
jgi:steroid delta-isomerase-like uncharacterized protein